MPVRKRTPWRPQPDGAAVTERAGAREWFSDRLFVEAQDDHRRTGFSTSITAHVVGALVLVVVLITQSSQPLLVRVGSHMVMPVMMSMLPVADVPAPAPASRPVEASARQAMSPEPAAAPEINNDAPPAPIEAPATIAPETGRESSVAGVEGGVAGGVAGGVVGGVVGGVPSSGGASGPFRLGGGGAASIRAPRKIKEVKPVYPQSALPEQARGSVIIEAIIGTDGKVQDAKVLQSIPALDQAALEAVRQWEFAPSLLNGVPVAVIMTVVVNFAIQ